MMLSVCAFAFVYVNCRCCRFFNRSNRIKSAAMDNEAAEEMALALVREYLSRKGFKKSLATLSGELPAAPTPTTRGELASKLGISKLLKVS